MAGRVTRRSSAVIRRKGCCFSTQASRHQHDDTRSRCQPGALPTVRADRDRAWIHIGRRRDPRGRAWAPDRAAGAIVGAQVVTVNERREADQGGLGPAEWSLGSVETSSSPQSPSLQLSGALKIACQSVYA